MPSDLPFVNSAYGDNHDRAVMTSLSREEFVAAAASSNVENALAHRLFVIGGGPDAVYQALIDVAMDGEADILERCVSRLGDGLDRFLEYTFAEPGYDRETLLARLALGCLRPIEEAFVSKHLLFNFLAKKDANGRIMSSTPVLSRVILRRGRQGWHVFEDCLKALASSDYSTAHALAANVDRTAPHLRAFCGIVDILVSLKMKNQTGLLGIDWTRIRITGQQLLDQDIPLLQHRPWVETLTRWARVIYREAVAPETGRPQLDTLTVRAAESDIHELLVFSMFVYLNRVRQSAAHADLVQAIVSLPEAILQALAAAHCGIDFKNAPENLPALDYNRFFGAQSDFRLSRAGSKMELTSLLVVVPALMSYLLAPERRPADLCEPTKIRPLQQKLVDRLRNPSAHGYCDFTESDAKELVKLCTKWLNAMAVLAGHESAASLPVMLAEPSIESLSSLLYGGEGDAI